MESNMFPTVAGSSRLGNLKSNFPYNQDPELETQRSRLANLKNQPTNVKRRRPASRQANRRTALGQVGRARKTTKVILEPIKPRTPNELDHKLNDDSLRKFSAFSLRTTIDEETENIQKEANEWKLGLKGDLENIFGKDRKNGNAGQLAIKTRSISVGTPPVLRLHPSASNSFKPGQPQNMFLPSVTRGPIPKESSDNMFMKKSLSESRLTTPRNDSLTPIMDRSVSISSLSVRSSLSVSPSIPPSPSISLMSTLPLTGSLAAPFITTSEESKDHEKNIPLIEAPSAKLSFSKIHNDATLDIMTERYHSPERPLSSSVQKQIEEAATMIQSSDEERQLKGTSIMHKHLLDERNPPIDAYLELEVVEPLAKCLSSSRESLVLGALLAISGIVCGNHEQTTKVVEANVIPDMIRLLDTGNEEIIDQCIICLGNIAGGSDDFDFKVNMFEGGVLKHLTDLVEKGPKVERGQKLAWALSNLSQPNYLPIDDLDMDRIIDAILKLLEVKDQDTNQTAMWVLSYITERSGNQINDVIDKGFIPIIFQKIAQSSDYPSMLFPMLRVMGNIASGDHEQTQNVIDHGLIPFLVKHCGHYILKIRKECLWIISNITAGVEEQIQATIDYGVFPALNKVVQKETDLEILKEAGWAISNVLSGGSTEHVDFAVDHDFPKCLVRILFRSVAVDKSDDGGTATLCLEALKECVNKCSSFDKFYKSTFDQTSLEDFAIFTHHENESTASAAKDFIEYIESVMEATEADEINKPKND